MLSSRISCEDFPGGPVAKTSPSNAVDDVGSTPGQGTRSHMQQLKDSAYHSEDGRSQVQPHKYLKQSHGQRVDRDDSRAAQ